MANPQRLVLHAGAREEDGRHASIFFVGTATVLIRHAGFTLLTDPNFLHAGDHVHLGYGIHAERRTNPAIELDELPPIDAVVLSHLHEDHFDRVVEARLDRAVPIVTTPHAARRLRDKGFRSPVALRTWEALEVEKGASRVRLTSAPARHGPPLVAGLLPPVMGTILDFRIGERRTLRMYISGDTLPYHALRQIPERFPGIDVALLHLGGTRILGVVVTMNGRQGVEAMRMIAPRLVVPIHYDDYDVFRSPLEEFAREVERAHLTDLVHYMARGDTLELDLPRLRGEPPAPPPPEEHAPAP